MSMYAEVMESAARQLDERGLLLDLHISQLAGGDKSLVDLIRNSLTKAGVAEDRFGMSLARVGKAGVCMAAWRDGRLQATDGNILTAEPEPDAEQEPADWWLMSKGAVRGPWPMSQLIAMRQTRQLSIADLVREGTRGPWLNLSQIPELAALTPETPPMTAASHDSTSQPSPLPVIPPFERKLAPVSDRRARTNPAEQVETDPLRSGATAPPAKDCLPDSVAKKLPTKEPAGSSPSVAQITALANSIAAESSQPNPTPPIRSAGRVRTRSLYRSGIETIIGAVFSPFTGIGERLLSDVRRLASLLLVPAAGVALVLGLWWFWPPSSAGILREFESSRQQVEALKRSKMSHDQLIEALRPTRRRVQRLVRVLESRATDQPSIHRELLLAGKHGLLVVLEHPQRSEIFEEMYALHARQARMLLDGVAPETAIQEAPSGLRQRQPIEMPVAAPTSADESAE